VATEEATTSLGTAFSYRKERWRVGLRRFRSQWRIYYRNSYGRAGLYILLAFLVIALLSPVLIFHDPTYFIAPPEDSYSASLELAAPLPGNASGSVPWPIAASSLVVQGSYVGYETSNRGPVYAVGLGGSPSTPAGKVFNISTLAVPSGWEMLAPDLFPLANYSEFTQSNRFVYDNYLLLGVTNSTQSKIFLGREVWSGGASGIGTPRILGGQALSLNGSLVAAPVSDSSSQVSVPGPWAPFFSSTSFTQGGFKPGYIYTITQQAATYYLTEIYTSPLSIVWSVPLSGTGSPSVPAFLGSYYISPSSTEVLVAQSSSLAAYSPLTGRVLWTAHFSSPVNTNVGPVIPANYQLLYFNPSFVAFVAAGGSTPSVQTVALGTGATTLVTNVPANVTGLAVSAGSSGYPSYVTVQTASTAYFLLGKGAVADSASAISLPSQYGPYPYNPVYAPSQGIMVLTGLTGRAIAVKATLGPYPFTWTIAPDETPTAVSAPVLMTNSYDTRTAVAYAMQFPARSPGAGIFNEIIMYSTTGVDNNPLPPTLHSPSGNVYLFGTNIYGNDVWSQWVASFVPDWEVGIAVAIGVMAIAVVTAMFIGFTGGWLSSVVETLTLAIFLIPGLALLIVVASIAGPSFTNIVLVLTLVGWPFTTFTLIGVVKSIRTRTFIDASRVSGAGTLQILRRHILSNMTPLLVYFMALTIGGAVTGLSTLQFLGVAPLTIQTWGGMLEPVLGNFYLAVQAPWWILPPTITLAMFVFAFIFVSRGLDDVVNPRIRPR